MLTVNNLTPRSDAKVLVLLDAVPGVAVTWSVASGPGVITGLSSFTDASGRAYALYNPNGTSGAAVLRATYGS